MNVFIVEDEPIIVDTLKAYFEREGWNVQTAFNGADGLTGIIESKPDFILLDLMLPDISGEEICVEVRKTLKAPIIMLTAKTAEDDRIHGIEIGADDYVTKPFSPREVVARIKGILRRLNDYEKSEILSFNRSELVINRTMKAVELNNEKVSLTPNEYKLLEGIAAFPSRTFTRMELVKLISEGDYFEGYERNIDVHIKNIRKKIEANSREPKYIQTVFGYGYKFGGNIDV